MSTYIDNKTNQLPPRYRIGIGGDNNCLTQTSDTGIGYIYGQQKIFGIESMYNDILYDEFQRLPQGGFECFDNNNN